MHCWWLFVSNTTWKGAVASVLSAWLVSNMTCGIRLHEALWNLIYLTSLWTTLTIAGFSSNGLVLVPILVGKSVITFDPNHNLKWPKRNWRQQSGNVRQGQILLKGHFSETVIDYFCYMILNLRPCEMTRNHAAEMIAKMYVSRQVTRKDIIRI